MVIGRTTPHESKAVAPLARDMHESEEAFSTLHYRYACDVQR